MSAPSRRTLLAAPVAIAALPATAGPPAAESCLALGLKLGQAVKAYQQADRAMAGSEALRSLMGPIDHGVDAVLGPPIRSIEDVFVKLVAALERLNYSEDCEDGFEGGRGAAAALRQCLFALGRMTNTHPSAFGADFFDNGIWQATHRGAA